MKDYICLKPGKRGLTKLGQKAFIDAYQSLIVFDEAQPNVWFPPEAYAVVQEIAKLRMRDWKTTRRFDPAADVTGIAGELAAEKCLGFSAEEALSLFEDGLKGDPGYDFKIGDFFLDKKNTKGPGRWRFSKTNRHRDKATHYIFGRLEETSIGGCFVTVLGFAGRAEIRPWVREDSRSYFVRYETLHREGILRPLSELKNQKEG